MAPTPQTAADADVMAISRQGLADFYATIHQSYYSKTNDIQRLIDRVWSLEAQLGMVTTAQDDVLAEADTWRGRFDEIFQMLAHLGAGGNVGGGGSFPDPTVNSTSLHCLPGTSSWRL